MSLLFIGLSIPILIFILIYNYNKNSAGMVSILNDAVAQTSRAAVERTENLIDSTETPLRFLAEVAAADPGYFRTEQSNDLLYRALTSASHIDAVYVSFEDGYHRVVTRIDEDRRRSDPRYSGGGELARQLHRCDHLCALAGPASQIFRRLAASGRRVRCCNRPRHPDFARLSGGQDNADARGDRTRNQSRHRFPHYLLCVFRSFMASTSSAAHPPTSPWTCCRAFSTNTAPARTAPP